MYDLARSKFLKQVRHNHAFKPSTALRTTYMRMKDVRLAYTLYLCVTWFSEETVINSAHSVNQLVFLMENVSFTVR
jgi:hypothetical protein